MPIYAYRCEACGHAKDVLQKVSDPLLTTCPACGAESFKKQVTAAGFQLKGSGWYVTDFRNGPGTPATADKPSGDSKPSAEGAGKGDAPASKDTTSGADATGSKAESAPAAPAPSPAAGGTSTTPPSSST
ncbi:MAG: FmdB family zinc ribbon protein [Rhizobacter sp.]